jgi:hypothetical protein
MTGTVVPDPDPEPDQNPDSDPDLLAAVAVADD